ncbi:MAG: hypothetical protein ACI4AE_00725 [Candidatus Cryptobacteroides sp.]
MKTSKLLAFAASFAAMVCLNSCSKESNDDSGNGNNKEPETGVAVADVFFSAENGDYCYYVTPDGSAEAVLTIIRDKVTDEAEYAIKVVSADEGIEVPSSVKFANGATSSSITVKAPASGKVGDVYSFELMLTGDNVNSSANSTAGTLRCEGSFYFYEELRGIACFKPWSEGGDIADYMGYIAQTVWKVDTKTLIFKDFLGNGHDLKVIVDESGSITQLVYDYYDLYLDKVEGDDGNYLYFYSDKVAEFADDGYNERFAPKGDARTVSGLSFYVNGTYSMYKEGDSKYLYIAVPTVSFYVKDGERTKDYNWQYFCFYALSDEDLAKYDTVGFPELPETADVVYPEATIGEEEVDGLVPVQFLLCAENVYLDTQYAQVVDGNFYFENFMWSDCNLTIKPDGNTFYVEVTDKDGNVVSGTVTDGYEYLGMEYLWPWESNYVWVIRNLYRYDAAENTTWDAEAREAYFWGSYTIYDGTSASWLAPSTGYVGIFW